MINTESEQLRKVGKHENLVSLIDEISGTYNKPGRAEIKIKYLVLDYASEGELFCFISKENPLSEEMARFVFAQILDGLEHIHQSGVAHRDLKIENILVDSEFNIKLTDFGFAGPIEGRGRDGKLTTRLGTPNYLAPEVILKEPYFGEKIDIFACAAVLFVLLTFQFPFHKAALINDPFYKFIAARRSDLFWKKHASSGRRGENFFSAEFKDLFSKMVALDSARRPSI